MPRVEVEVRRYVVDSDTPYWYWWEEDVIEEEVVHQWNADLKTGTEVAETKYCDVGRER
jgi:hypothetical protein